MLKKLLFFSLFLSTVAFSQGNDLLWAQGFGSTEFDMVLDIATDNSGNIISVGRFSGTVDFDQSAGTNNLTSDGFTDIFVMKQDSDGNLLWVHRFGDHDTDAGNSVAVDASNNIYVTGMYRYEVDFDPGPADYILGNWGASAGQIFLLKLDSDGDLVWVNSMGNYSGSSQGFCLAVEPTGLAVISGSFYGTVDFDPSAGTTNLIANATTNNDIFLATYGADGGFGTAYGFGGNSGTNRPYDLTLDVANSIILTGTFGGTIDLDPTAGVQNVVSNGNDDIFMMKFLAGGGIFLWAKSIGGIYSDGTCAVTTDSNEDIYFSGGFYDNIDLDPNAGTANFSAGGAGNTYILKLSWNGTFVWGTTLTGGYSNARAMDTDENDDIYILGGYSLTTDFDPGAGTANHTSADNFDDIYLVKLDSDGLYQWSKSFGANSDDRGSSIDVISSDEFYIGGYYTNNIDFNPTGSPVVLNAIGTIDNYIAKFGTCGLDLSVSLTGATLTANATGATYQWMDCNAFAPVTGATSQNFSPAADGDYAVIITQGSCKDTSTCYTVVGVGINEINNTQISVYPNPANSNLTIQTTENILVVSIYNSAGVFVKAENKNTFSVENLPAGIYFLQVQTESGISTARFVKE